MSFILGYLVFSAVVILIIEVGGKACERRPVKPVRTSVRTDSRYKF